MLKLTRIVAGAAAMLALSASTALAAPPTPISIKVDQYLATVNGADGYGWSRITINADRKLYVAILRNNPDTDTGVLANTVDELRPDQFGQFGRWVAGGNVRPGKPFVTTIDLVEGRRYTVIYTEKGKMASAGDWLVTPNSPGGDEPTADATIELRDFRIVTPKELPRRGTIKLVNAGRQLHELYALPLAPKANAKQAVKLAKHDQFRKIELAGPPRQITGLVDGGTTSYLEPRLKPGKWLLICAYRDKHSHHDSHALLGMATVVTVR